MKKKSFWYFITLVLVTSLVLKAGYFKPLTNIYSAPIETESNNTNDHKAFHKMMDVLTHERCINCHPSDHIPKQGDDSHPHYFGMSRGEGNMGFDATKCTTCHQNDNNPYSGVPGAPEWSLAPEKMKWEGLTRAEIARSMLNKENNGNRNHEELIHHLTEHELVLWAWTPGVDAEGLEREKPPVPLEEYRKAVHEWFENGAIIPEE